MVNSEDQAVVNEIRERYRKQDPSLRLSLFPHQFIIGNYSPRLKSEFPIVFQHNNLRRIAIRIKIEGNPLVGYQSQDIGVTLTQIESISVKDEYQDNLPAIVMSFRQECMHKLWKLMPGMREMCSKSYIGEDRAKAYNVTCILNHFPNLPEAFCKIEFRKNGVLKHYNFDFDVVKMLFLTEIKAVWTEILNAQFSLRQTIHLNRTYETMREMSNHAWVEYLTSQKLLKSTCGSGETMYIRSDDNPAGRRMTPTGQHRREFQNEYPTAARHEKRSLEAMKGVTKCFEQRREAQEPTVIAKRTNIRDIFIDPITLTKKERPVKIKRLKMNNENERNIPHQISAIEDHKPIILDCSLEPTVEVEIAMEYSDGFQVPRCQATANDYQMYSQFSQYSGSLSDPLVNETVTVDEYITERMRNLGTEADDVEMSSSHAIPGLSGDFSHCQQYEPYPNGHQHAYSQNANSGPGWMTQRGETHYMNEADEQTVHEEVLAEFFYTPKTPQTSTMKTSQGDTSASSRTTPAAKRSKNQHNTQETGQILPKTPSRLIPKPKDQVQQMQMTKKTLIAAKPSPKTRPVSSPYAPMYVEERVSADTTLFTFPHKDQAVPGIDPVVLLVKDVRTLDRKEFVNDNIMTFMLNYIAVYLIDKDLMPKIILNNTYFYSNLTRNLPALCFNQRRPIDPIHHGKLVGNCARVFRWTRKFDVFKRDYIVIPINEDFHWLLVTVFNPAGAIVDPNNEKESRAKPKCYVAFFDPLSGLDPVKRNHMCHCVITYLRELYKETKGPGKKFAEKYPTIYDEKRVVITRPVNTPIQANFYDCGLYALHYIEGIFCYPARPVTVEDFPNFDWSRFYPKANDMADLMRDKIYNLVLHIAGDTGRSRLSRFERAHRHGLSQEGPMRKARRHSAVFRLIKRHPEYRPRHYSVHPASRAVMDDPMFLNPREMAEMPITQKVRSLKWPEENFPIIY